MEEIKITIHRYYTNLNNRICPHCNGKLEGGYLGHELVCCKCKREYLFKEELNMAYMIKRDPLIWFKGVSTYSIYRAKEGFMWDNYETYDDTLSLIDFIGHIIVRETNDSNFAGKIVKILAKKLNIKDELLRQPIDKEQFYEK
jgi:hypothetical protein